MAKWYEIKALGTSGAVLIPEIYIYGNIGDTWSDTDVIAAELVQEIALLDVEKIIVRINSYGGSVTDGFAIYNAFKRHKATIEVQIDGVAISCASYIAMAGDTITMAKNAMMMIHAPWGYGGGNAVAMREQADVLDRYAAAMSSAYADASGKSQSDALALLTDGVDHWYSADEALAEGFCDTVGPAVEVAASLAQNFNLTRFKSKTPQGAPMPQPVHATFARTKEDNAAVVAMFKPFASAPGVQALQTDVLSDPALTLSQVQAKLLAEIGKDSAPAMPAGSFPHIQTVTDSVDVQRAAAVQALLVRSGVETDAKVKAEIGSNPYRGHKLLDFARASLMRAGKKVDGMTQMEIVASAFTQGGSDFPVLLENTMHKALQGSYVQAALTWNRFCAVGSVSDFRAHSRYRTGSFGTLDTVNELGEFTNKSIPDGEKGSVQASTKGNIINLSRQAIINDDLGAFVGLAGMLGRAAARSVEADVYALLALNAGLGPVLVDGKTLFHADHKNIGTASALAMLAIDADRVLMASQTDVSGNDYLDLRPAVLLVPIGLGGTARGINAALYDPDTANKMQKPNIVNGLYRDIVDTPRLTGTRRYSFCDATEAPVLEVAFLDGMQNPFLEVKDGFDVDGARYKVRLDYGVAAVDYRGAVTNAGQ